VSVSKEITRLEKSNVRLTLTIPKEDVASGYRDVLADYAKNVQMPGFRRGKVPPAVLERKFGEALKEEALGKILENAIEEVFGGLPDGEKPLSYSQPAMDERPKFDTENDLVFSLVYDVLPKITVGQWKGLEIEVPECGVGDEDVARELETVRDRNSFVLDREDGAKAQKGDIATIDCCELDEGGEPVPGTLREGFAYTIGSGQAAYAYDDDITGMAKGETREFSAALAGAAPPAEGEAVEAVRLRVTLTELKEKKLPELDDELAQDVDEKFETLDDLKKDLRERLEARLEARIRELKISGLLEKIAETSPVVLPESMVKAEIAGRIHTLGRQFGMDGASVMRMLSQGGEGLENLDAAWRPAAEKSLHSRLIVQTLMEERNIEVSDGDLRSELEKISGEMGISCDELMQRYSAEERLDDFKDAIRERLFFDFLLSENAVKAGPRAAYLDLMSNNG